MKTETRRKITLVLEFAGMALVAIGAGAAVVGAVKGIGSKDETIDDNADIENETEENYIPTRHREHGWYLPNDDD